MWKDRLQNLLAAVQKNGKIVYPIGVIAVVAATLTVVLNISDKKEEDIVALNTEIVGESIEILSVEEAAEVTLEQNEDEALKTLLTTYYNALADGDEATLLALCDEYSERDLMFIVERAKYIEKYDVLEIYTKKGPEDGSTIAYVFFKLKFYNQDEAFPGYTSFYICTNEAGELYIRRGENSQSVNDYILKAHEQADVVEFNNRVNVEYNELVEAHPELLEYLTEVNSAVQTAVALTVADNVTEETTPDGEEEGDVADGDVETPGDTQEETPVQNTVQYVKTTTTVNVRSSDSENAEKIGKASQNTTLQVVEQQVNGWTKIVFEGKEGFIKSEFLQVIESADSASAIGSVTATTNINVRAEASETAERLGVLLGGETVELYANENGWCKINYNGRIAYVKAEYVE